MNSERYEGGECPCLSGERNFGLLLWSQGDAETDSVERGSAMKG